MKKISILKALILLFVVGIICSLIAIVVADYCVDTKGENRNIMQSGVQIKDAPNVALLLGTSKYVQGGWINLYYKYRIEAVVDLYRTGRIKHIVISGDNSRKFYNEPEDMKNDLVKAGIPASSIYLDYAGFNTYDSVLRMKHIFGQNSFIVVSQTFHADRAIYIAQWHGLDAWSYPAKDVSKYYGFKTALREKLARVKMFLDLFSGRDPHFLGEQIVIE